ncbi:MAG TPA: response regulator [Ktedonobacteraceae bacterium]|nr:response regulator [Ktedonobacteraceae bacterium]
MSHNSRRRKILVVDDDPIIRDMMVDMLECEGFSLRVARNGQEALKMLRGDESYLVFLDVMMPVMSGKEVCEQLEAEPGARERHTIFLMSALDKLEEVTSCKVDGIITKPFVVDDVLLALETHAG